MSHHDQSLHQSEAEDRIWDLAEKIGTAVLTTWTGSEQHGRPLAAHVAREERAIYFLVDEDGAKNDEIAQYPQVSVAFSDPGANSYVFITGTARVTDDRAKIADLWSSFSGAWWDDENDPAIRLLTVTPERGEVWDGPGRVASLAKIALAAVSDKRPDMGDHAKAQL